MEQFKFKKLYLSINVLLIIFAIGLLVTSIAISDRSAVYYTGIVERIVFGILLIFNGIWNCSPNYYSIANNSKNPAGKTTPKWPWVLIAALGIGMIVTAFMGYGFNGVNKPV
jgi:purine-cytosine permease-like protein